MPKKAYNTTGGLSIPSCRGRARAKRWDGAEEWFGAFDGKSGASDRHIFVEVFHCSGRKRKGLNAAKKFPVCLEVAM